MKTNRSLSIALAIICVVTLIGMACTPSSGPVSETTEKTIKIGLNLTFTGPAATTYAAMSKGPIEYFNYLNEELGGIEYKDPVTSESEKTKLHVIWEDGSMNVAKALTIYKRQKAEGVGLMIITGGSSVETISSMASNDHMPLVGLYVTSATAVSMAPNPLYYTSGQPDNVSYAGFGLRWIKDNWTEPGRPKVGCIMMDYPSQRVVQIPEGFPAYAEELGIDIVGIEFTPVTSTDFTVELTRLMSKEADYILLGLSHGQVGITLSDAERLGVKDKAKFIAIWTLDENLLRVAAPEAIDGLYGYTMVNFLDADLPGVKLARETIQKSRGEDITSFELGGWCTAMIVATELKATLEEAGYENLTGELINDSLHHITDLDTGGIIPLLTVDPEYPRLFKHAKMLMNDKGTIKAISDWTEIPELKEWMNLQ